MPALRFVSVYDFNIISSLFGKNSESIVSWIEQGKATYINKEKALKYLAGQSAPIAAAYKYSRLYSVAKVVKEFKNPNSSDKKIFDCDKKSEDDSVRLRIFGGSSDEHKFLRKSEEIRHGNYLLFMHI